MTTEQYLKEYQNALATVKNRNEELKNLELNYETLSSFGFDERVQTSPTNDKLEKQAIKISNYRDEIVDCINNAIAKEKLIASQIQSMVNVNKNYYDVLFKTYILNKTFNDISREMFYGYKQVKRMHNDAIKCFEEKYGSLYLNCKSVHQIV